MLATVLSASLLGVRGHRIRVEVHVSNGLPGFTIVGLPDASCREARDRVRAAMVCSGFKWPDTRITVNLAPSALRKAGSGLDLAIAVGIVVASKQLNGACVHDVGFVGELGLDGSLRAVPGTLPLVAAAGASCVVVPHPSHAEAALVPDVHVSSAATLREVVDCLDGLAPWPKPPDPAPEVIRPPLSELALVQGQPVARKAIEVAAAGGHHLLFIGPPGAGKTMLAKALADVLPGLDVADALEITTVHSAAGVPLPPTGLVDQPPFRAPHHTSSMVSLVGGGTQALRPGELSCAHAGVLFLDELGEFPASVLDALRQPLEDGVVRVARAYGSTTLPARVVLVAAMNPCPCGEGSVGGQCRCGDAARLRYTRRVSGPLLDRFDLRVHVDRPKAAALFSPTLGESTACVASRVAAARVIALERGYGCNARIPVADLDTIAALADDARRRLQASMEAGHLSARGVHRVRRVARTLADLDGAHGPISAQHVTSALALRAEVLTLAPTGSNQ